VFYILYRKPLVILSANSGIWRLIIFRLDIETKVIGKGGTKRGCGKGGPGEEVWALLSFVVANNNFT
jgi:hypothetical protein